MGSIGRCCCQDACCCIDRIDIDFAVPTAGQPGASIGSWGWDVTETPEPTEQTQTIDGVPRLVTRCFYTAPTTTVCIPPEYDDIPGYPLSYNTYFLILERNLLADYYLSVGGDRWLFTGNIRWRVYAYVQDLVLRVERWGTNNYRSFLSGTYALTRERAFDGTITIYDGSTCNVKQTVIQEPPSEHFPCNRVLPDNACNYGAYLNPARTNLQRSPGYGINMDTGWVEGSCASIPTTSVASPTIFGGYNSTSPPGNCRVPSGSTYTTVAGTPPTCAGLPTEYYQQTDTFTADAIWFATHPFTITPCSSDPAPDEEPPV